MSKSFSLNKSLGFHLNRLAAAMRAHFAARLGEHGFKVSEWALLAAVRQGAQTPGAVARMMALDPAAVTRTLDRLADLGLIARKTSESDARSHVLELTADGIATVTKLGKEAEATNRQFASGLTPGELTQLISLLDRMFANRPLGD